MVDKFTNNITKQKIQFALGVLWIIDGCLQLQPKMFSSKFANQVLVPASQGQPAFVHGPIIFAVNIMLHNPALINIIFVLTQLSLGVLILNKKTVRLGLNCSIIWALCVWYFGEGLGGLAGGQSSLLMGAPGAALLYAIIGFGVLPNDNDNSDTKIPSWFSYIWMAIWMGGEILLLWSQSTVKTLSIMIAGNAKSAPKWLASIDIHFSNWLLSRSEWFLAVILLLYFAIGFTVLMSRKWRFTGIILGVILSILFWIVGQSLGGYYTGLATDVSTAPLIIMLGIAILGTKKIELNLY